MEPGVLVELGSGRTIILSTHHMDEADVLGDRIAIISHGKVCCCGSSLFLKKTYGSGYYLTLVRTNQEIMTSQRYTGGTQLGDASSLDEGIGSGSISTMETADVADVTSVIRLHIPEAEFLEVIGQELVYILPYAGSKDGSFASLFKELDLEKERLGISSYGISDTSLEEIFLKVAEETGVDVETTEKREMVQRDWKRSSKRSRSDSMSLAIKRRDSAASKQEKKGRFLNRVKDGQLPTCVNGKGSYVITGWHLIRQQFLALFIKRFHHARRSRKGIIAQVVLPALFVCLSLIFSLILPPFVEYPNLELQPWMYGKPQNTFYSADRMDIDQAMRVTRALLSEPGFGTRCMEGNPIAKYPCTPSGATDWFTPSVDPSILEIFKNGNWSMQNPSPDCQCSTPQRNIMLPDCPPGAGGLPPPQKTQNTTDTLQDLTARNMTDFLLKTYAKSGKIRYGGISVGAINSQVILNESEITTLLSDLKTLFNSSQSNITEKFFQDLEILLVDLGTKDNVKVWFYNQGWHAIVSFLNVATNAILRGNLPAGVQPKLYGISAFNHPLNLTKQQLTATL
ncbi:phospholipid-transporting ATPase ABCA1 isoform X1 [Tachysurus ichikawai]